MRKELRRQDITFEMKDQPLRDDVRILGTLTYLRMARGQQQGIRVADFRFDQAQVAGRVKKTRIPALPVGQQFFDLVTECHGSNVYEPRGGYNDVAAGKRAAIDIGGGLLFQELTAEQHRHDECCARHDRGDLRQTVDRHPVEGKRGTEQGAHELRQEVQ